MNRYFGDRSPECLMLKVRLKLKVNNDSSSLSLHNSQEQSNSDRQIPPKIRVVMADDQKLICRQVQSWLEPEADLEIVGIAHDGATAINLIESTQPDVALIDLQMPKLDGFETIEIIANRFPNCHILILSSSEEGQDVQKALKAGAGGYLLKNTSAQGMVNSIRSAANNQFQLSPGLFNKVFLSQLDNKGQKNTNRTRVVIVDDQKFICRQVQSWLESEADLEIVGTAHDGATAINLIESTQPDVALIDLQMPKIDGFETIEIIANRFPNCHILTLSSSENRQDVQKALKAGAGGYLLKSASAQEMVNSVRCASKNYFQLSPGLSNQVILSQLNKESQADSTKLESSVSTTSAKSTGNNSQDRQKNKLFRQQSLERLSSPERLDRLMEVVNPKAWIPLTTVGFLSATALVWSVFGSIPVTVKGAGVLVYPSTVMPLQSQSSGQLLDIKVSEGEAIAKGDVIATVDRQDLQEQLDLAEAKLTQLQGQNSKVSSIESQRQEQDIKAIEEQKQALEDRLGIVQSLTPTLKDKGLSAIQVQIQNSQARKQTLEELRPTLESRLEKRRALFERGAISEDVFLQAKQEYLDNISNIDRIDAELKDLEVKEADAYQQYLTNLNEIKNIEAQIQDLDSKKVNLRQQDLQNSTTRSKEIQQAKREISQIKQQIASESQIISQHTGKVLELTVNPGQVIDAGTRVATLDTDRQEVNLVGMTYFPVQDGKKIKPGMEIQVTPQTVKRERFGGIVGTVTKVSPFPITSEAAAKKVGSPQIISGLVSEQQPAVIQISANLKSDEQTFSGFQWSSSSGPELKMSPGTTTSARVKIEERAPITFVLPILRSVSGIY